MSEASQVVKISDQQLTSVLEGLCKLPISADVLKQPTPHFISEVFKCLFKDLGLNTDLLKEISWNTMKDLKNPESFSDILPFMNYFAIARRISHYAGINDFGIGDLTDPKPKRTKKILTHLTSLWKHALTKFQKYNDVKEKVQSEIEYKQSLNERMKQSIEELDNVPVLDQSAYEKALKTKSENERKIAEWKKVKEESSKKQRDVKTELALNQTKLNELNVKIINKKEHLEDLNCAILKSPERMGSEIQHLKNQLAEENSNYIALMKTVKEQKEDVRKKLESLKEISNNTKMLKEVMADAEELRKSTLLVKDLQETINKKFEDLHKEQAVLNSKNNQIQKLEQRIAQLELQNKLKRTNLTKISEMHEETYNKNLLSLKSSEAIYSVLKNEDESCRLDWKKHDVDHASTMTKFYDDKEKLLKIFEDYADNLSKKLDARLSEEMEKSKEKE